MADAIDLGLWDIPNSKMLMEFKRINEIFKNRLKAVSYDKWVLEKLSWICDVVLYVAIVLCNQAKNCSIFLQEYETLQTTIQVCSANGCR